MPLCRPQMYLTNAMKKLFLLVIGLALMTSCKSAWRSFEDPMAGLPRELPKRYMTNFGTHVYSEKPPTEEEMNQIALGIFHQLGRSHRDNMKWDQPGIWKTWKRYEHPRDYSVLIIEPQAYGQMPDTKGCGLINVRGITAAGTVKGFKLGTEITSAGDGPWIIVPHLINDDPNCIILFRRGVDHESEHIRLMNNLFLFLFYQGAEDSHPIFDVLPGEDY